MRTSKSLASAFLTSLFLASNAVAQLDLDPANVQTASQADGLAEADSAEAFTPSATDAANFINFCTGKTLSNGLQVLAGSCNGIPMGDIPSSDRMVSAIIINPPEGGQIPADTPFDIIVKVNNLQAGTFVNPQTNYYSSPQQLNTDGIIIGHIHVTIQNLGGSFTPNEPPKADTFEFFKGINDAGDGNGLLKANAIDGLPEGFYRVCTINSSSNHQGVLSPVEERGAQDDCSKFQVVAADAAAIADAEAADAAVEAAEGAAIAAEGDAAVDADAENADASADAEVTADADAESADADADADTAAVDAGTDNANANTGAAAGVNADSTITDANADANVNDTTDVLEAVDSAVDDAAAVVEGSVGDVADPIAGAAEDVAAATDGTPIDDVANDAAAVIDGVASDVAAKADRSVDNLATAVKDATADIAANFRRRKFRGRRKVEWRA